jgi:hypothetical protein
VVETQPTDTYVIERVPGEVGVAERRVPARGPAPSRRRLTCWWIAVAVLVLIGTCLLAASVVMVVRREPSRVLQGNGTATLGGWIVPPGEWARTACPSPLQWAQGHHDTICSQVVSRRFHLGVLYLVCGFISAALGGLAGRHRKRLVKHWLIEGAGHGRDLPYVEPLKALKLHLHDDWHAASLRDRSLVAVLVPLALLLLLVPPFTLPSNLGWRWVTDRVPWQIVDAVPWSPYPITATNVRVDDAGTCANEHIFAFGRWFDVPTASSGVIRQVSRTHFADGGVSVTGRRWEGMDCAIP